MLIKYLKNKGYTNIHATNMFIIAEGDLPVCLCAHMDTVFYAPPKQFYFDQEQKVMWSPDGLGTDDRAGIYAIIMLIERGYKPSLIFTDLEEKGGQGAMTLIEQYHECPFADCRALIQLDRQGHKDAVFYECDNQDFTDLVLSYGFDLEWGTFTDISIFGPTWEVAAVNLAVGYENEHTHQEIVHTDWLEETIDKVEKMLLDCTAWASYSYIPAPKIWNPHGFHKYGKIVPESYWDKYWWDSNKCAYCGDNVPTNEGIVIDSPGGAPEDAMLLCDECAKIYQSASEL